LALPLGPERVQSAFERQFERDALGHQIHVGLGLAWCFLASWPTSVVEIAQIPLIIYALVRLTNTHATIKSWALQPLVMLVALFGVWQAISLFWTRDLAQGLDDLSAMRWAWVTLALWPVMDRRNWFVLALALGFLPGMLMQAMHARGIDLGLSLLRFTRPPSRLTGWWDPAVAGSLLIAALGLHLPAVLIGVGRTRWLALIGSLATLVAILATGTRGAWIAATGLVLTMLTAAAWRRRSRRQLVPILALVLVGGVILGTFAWSDAGKGVRQRVREARRELIAVSRGNFSTFTGGRVLMAREAAYLFASHPIGGVGVGGFEAAARARVESIEPGSTKTKFKNRIQAHAHNTWLHIAASTGLVGLGIALSIALVALRGAGDLRWTTNPKETYAAGPFVALIGFLWISLFDTLHLNAQTGAMLATLMGLSLLNAPTIRSWTATNSSKPTEPG
jgi:O-antigen ligase